MVLERQPADADALALHARIALAAGRLDEAGRAIEAALRLRPDQAEALRCRAALRRHAGEREGALADLHAAALAAPGDAELHGELGGLLRALGRPAEAGLAYARAAGLAPDDARLWNDLGVARQESGDAAGAEAAYRRALALDDGLALAHNNYGALRQQAGDLAAAEAHYRRALACDPRYAAGWKNLAAILQEHARFEEAEHGFGQAIALRPDFAEARAGQLTARLHRCEWRGLPDALAQLESALQRRPDSRISPFFHLGLDDSPAAQLQIARRWAAQYRVEPLPPRPPQRRERIRLGYLGGDFFSHATSWLTAGLFAGHDRARFEVWGYDYGRDDGSALRAQLLAGFDRFRQVDALAPAEIARQIRADGIDILIDLKGWTRGTRAETLAWRPAPVQVHYLAYPGTLGADWVDYLIADTQVAPVGADLHYAERLVRLPHCYQINAPSDVAARPGRAQAGLPGQGFVFCCFNQHYKLLPGMFDLWMQLLRAVPGSVLWLLDQQPGNRARLRHEAGRRGVDGERLVFAPGLPHAEHLARLALADLALDTLPYNSHTTASDALWAGVPLVSCRGRGFASRVAASCLHAVGLAELAVDTLADYQALATRLATEPDRLAAVRGRLAAARRQAPLFDTAATTRALEDAYAQMWERALAGLAPIAFEVDG
ncbi:O-linked N-acetylglucosamine transferase, SPINDLY family protein [Chitinimonas koreensis]|nr:tetratricopeptide repeat protein [Chitinimonas koreensis]QNM98328.1 tetratricopeptide repeat protein [Chitinimonas koreensis]